MPTNLKDRLPNRALSGMELRAISILELRAMLEKDPAFSANVGYRFAAFSLEAKYVLPYPHPVHTITSRVRRTEGPALAGMVLFQAAVEELDKMTQRDFIFGNSSAFRTATITLTAVFHVAGPYDLREGADKIVGVITGEAPLPEPLPPNASVIAQERVVKLENPNIDRINHGLPIIVQRATPPVPVIPPNQLPGEPPSAMVNPPGVENLEYRYDASQFPAPEKPVDTDISQKAAARLGVPVQTGADV
jgi:hypothetical protein